jgi:hypothetical protein
MEAMRRSGGENSVLTGHYSSKKLNRDLEHKIIRSGVLQEPAMFLSPKCSVDGLVALDLKQIGTSQKREGNQNLSFAAENNPNTLRTVEPGATKPKVLKQKPSFVSRLEDAKSNCTRLEESYQDEHHETQINQNQKNNRFILEHKIRDSDEQSEYVNEISTESTGKRDSYPLKDEPRHVFKGASKKSFKTPTGLKGGLHLPESLRRPKSTKKAGASGESMRKSQEMLNSRTGSREGQRKPVNHQYSDKMKLLINQSREQNVGGVSTWKSPRNQPIYRERASGKKPQPCLVDFSSSLVGGHNLYGLPVGSELQYHSLGASFEDSRADVPIYYYQNSNNQSAKSMIMSNIDCRSQVPQTNPFKENFTSHKKRTGQERDSLYTSNADPRMSGMSTDVGRENKQTAARTPKKTMSPTVKLSKLNEGQTRHSAVHKENNMQTFKLNMSRNKIGLVIKPNTAGPEPSDIVRRGSVEDTVSPFKWSKSNYSSKKHEADNWSKAKKEDSKLSGEKYTYLRKKKGRKEGGSNNLGNLTKGDVIEILKLHKNLQMKIKALEGQVTQFF